MLNCKIQSVEACPLTDPDPADGRPPPTASAASYAHAPRASYEPASATAASAAATPSCTAAPSRAPSYCAPGCASAPSCCAAAPAPAAASATGGRESYALAELGFVFFVEDIKCSQSDVRNFLLIEPDFGTRYVV
jgi:hypothetical protein